MSRGFFRIALAALCFALPASAEVAGVVQAGLPGEDAALVDSLKSVLQEAGYEVSLLDAPALCNPEKLAGLDLLVLPNAAALPADSVAPIETYLRVGGDIIALNTPMWRTLLINVDDKWLSRDEIARARADELPENLLCDFAPGSTDAWTRSTSETDAPAVYETAAEGPAQGRCALHCRLDAYRGWDNLGPQSVEQPFPEGHTLTVFAAKGGPDTHSLAVEWREKDGTRWIATVPLTTEWRQYVLAPEDFKFWESNPERKDGTFNPQNAVLFNVGLALTHTGQGGLSQEWWLSGFGTSPATAQSAALLAEPAIPKLETLSPTYKFFELNASQGLQVSDYMPAAKTGRGIYPRPANGGFDKGRAWCWMPILRQQSDSADGSVLSAMLVHADGPYKNGQWASFAIDDLEWYKSPPVHTVIEAIANAALKGLHIIDAGANFYTYFDGQDVTLGLRVANCGGRPQTATASVAVTSLRDKSRCLYAKEWPVEIAPGAETRVADAWRPDWSETGYLVKAELRQDGRLIDEASHEIHVCLPKERKAFITVEDGDFMLDGKRWRAHGVNYMPSSGIATEDHPYFEYWLGARSYDPAVIDRDLDHIVDMGLNSLSIFLYHQSLGSQNLLDLLRRLELRGLKANLSLRPGTPMDFEWEKVREMINYYRLAENDTVFAYDLAWEPMWMFQKDRRRWDDDWEAWVVERYGNIESAERDWEWPIPRDEFGNVTNPPVEHTDEDGPWRRMLAAYRRFLDTLLYKHYSRARDLVRSVDPNHLVSFRMTEAGDPTMSWRGVMPYDFPYLAAAVDILEPEAYGRIGDWEKVKPGWFEYEYARWAAPELPVMWAEAGVSAWDIGTMRSPEDKLAFQGEHLGHVYRMLINSGADGIFWWWYPGGFRTGENSDYGIINPDGTDRPATSVIRQHAEAFINGPPAREIDHWLETDRDARADGVPGIYKLAADEFWQAVEAGKSPGLKTAGTGTTSANCPLVAVGNAPCNGTNPPKYLDAFIDAVEVRDEHGQWQPTELPIPAGTRVRVRVTNLGEAEWIKRGDGAVCLAVATSKKTVRIPIKANVPPKGSTTFSFKMPGDLVKLSLDSKNRTPFGPQKVLGPARRI